MGIKSSKYFNVIKMLLDFISQGRPVSLDQCLQHFISSETIKEVECENCTKVRCRPGQLTENISKGIILLMSVYSVHFNWPSGQLPWDVWGRRVCNPSLLSQLQQGSRDEGQILENQRTTFIKQLKLGKVTLCSSGMRMLYCMVASYFSC